VRVSGFEGKKGLHFVWDVSFGTWFFMRLHSILMCCGWFIMPYILTKASKSLGHDRYSRAQREVHERFAEAHGLMM
jgi:uncharacterized membrane protein